MAEPNPYAKYVNEANPYASFQTVEEPPVTEAAPPEDMEEKERGVWGAIGEGLNRYGAAGVGMGEAALAVGSAVVAEPLAGLAGILGTALPGEAGQGAEMVEGVREGLAYEPRSGAGQAIMEGVGTFLEPVGKTVEAVETGLGETTLEATGSPLAATIAHTTPTALLEGLGLRVFRSARARTAADAERRIRVDPDLTPEEKVRALVEPEERTIEEITLDLKKQSGKKIAEDVIPDDEVRRSAEALGIDLNPSHYSTNEAYVRVEQAVKSQPGSKLAAREAEAIEQLSQKADELVVEFGGDLDKSLFDEAIRTQFGSTIKDLSTEAGRVYDRVRDTIPPATKINARASKAYLAQRLDDMGGDTSGLSTAEQAVHEVLNGERPPTYARFDQLRRDVGAGYNRQGPFKDEVSGNLDQVYRVLSQDQQGVADALGAGPAYAAGRKLVQTRKELEAEAMTLFGRDLNRSILPKLTQSATALTKGDVQQFKNLMKTLPENMRSRAAVTLLNDLFTHGARTRGSLGAGFANAYQSLQRNTGARRELFKYLPAQARRRFDAIGRVSQGIFRAKALENTSRTARDILQALESGSLVGKVVGHGARIGGMATGGLAGSVAGDIVSRAVKRKARQAEAADTLLSSDTFSRALDKAAEGKVKQAEIMLKKSAAWRAYRNTLGDATREQLAAVGIIPWLTQQPEQAQPQPEGEPTLGQ